MGENTNIEWADHSWNPWRGCTKVSQGCANCYAETLARRNPAVLGQWGKGAPRVMAKNWNDPVKWNRSFRAVDDDARSLVPRRCRVFPSLCDWLDDEVPVEWMASFLALIRMTPNLDWLLLTKRPENWKRRTLKVCQLLAAGQFDAVTRQWLDLWRRGLQIPHNVWLGVSVEDQKRASERIPLLMEIPARLRWLSVEPLLSPVDLSEWAHIIQQHHPDGSEIPMRRPFDWVVVGGESGHGARPCRTGWIRTVMEECQTAGVPVFVKQLGSRPDVAPIQHPKGGDPSEWPADLRVRQFPEVKP